MRVSVQVQYRLAVGLWLIATLCTWPSALSFIDEVGYVGNARLLLSGRMQPLPEDPGVWLPAPHGRVAKYPFVFAALIAPLALHWPRALFAISIAALIGLAELVRRLLQATGRDPRWALLFLVHPAFVILARTIMADVLLSLLAVAAWRALAGARRGSLIALLFAATCLLKPTGFIIAGALVAGEWATRFVPPSSSPVPAPSSRTRGLLAACTGIGAALAVAAGLNVLANGSVLYGYQQGPSPPMFALQHLGSSGLAHVLSLVLCPPLLILGAVPFVRRRELGPLFVIVALCGAMSLYFFVDATAGFLESVVLSQRLILPAVGLLLIGYAQGLADACERFTPLRRLQPLLTLLPACSALAIGLPHVRWQEPMAAALTEARAQVERGGEPELGIAGAATKAGLMFGGRVVVVHGTAAAQPRVVLCGRRQSYRVQRLGPPCDLHGYVGVASHGPLTVLTAGNPR